MTELYKKEIMKLKGILKGGKSTMVIHLSDDSYGSVTRVNNSNCAILEKAEILTDGYKRAVSSISLTQFRKKKKNEVVEIAKVLGIKVAKVNKKVLIDEIISMVQK